MFKIVNQWEGKAVDSPQGQQRGFPQPGVGQTGRARQQPDATVWSAAIPYMGIDTWEGDGYTYGSPSFPVDAQRGSPAPEATNQRYAPGDLHQPVPDGRTSYRVTRHFSRGAQRAAPITPYVLATANPGDRVPFKPNVVPRYPLGQYINNTIFWANQVIPTTVRLQGLQTQKGIEALLSQFVVYGKAETL